MSGTNVDLLVVESKSGKEDGLYAFSPNLMRPVTLEREREKERKRDRGCIIRCCFGKDLVVENGVTAKEPKRSFHSGKCNTLLLINSVFWPNFYFYLFLVILLFPFIVPNATLCLQVCKPNTSSISPLPSRLLRFL